MSTKLYCAICQKLMAELRDAKVRNGMVVYFQRCNPKPKPAPDMPEFLKGLFG